jgi:hypothetical protein
MQRAELNWLRPDFLNDRRRKQELVASLNKVQFDVNCA